MAEELLTYVTGALRQSPDLVTICRLRGSWVAFELDSLGTDVMRAEADALPAMKLCGQLWKGGLLGAPD